MHPLQEAGANMVPPIVHMGMWRGFKGSVLPVSPQSAGLPHIRRMNE